MGRAGHADRFAAFERRASKHWAQAGGIIVKIYGWVNDISCNRKKFSSHLAHCTGIKKYHAAIINIGWRTRKRLA